MWFIFGDMSMLRIYRKSSQTLYTPLSSEGTEGQKVFSQKLYWMKRFVDVDRNQAEDTVTFCSYYEASTSDVCRAEKLWHGAHSYSGMWGIKILESLRILIRILSLVHYHGGLISDDYVIKIIINVLLGTSLGSGPGGDCEFWTIKTLMGDPGHRRGNSDLGLVQIV